MQTFAPGAEELSLAVFTSESQREVLATIAFEAEATLAFNESITLTLKGEVDLARLAAAFAKVVARHSIFRSNFSLDGKYLMVAKNPQVKIEHFLDVTENDIRRWEEEAAHYRFDLIRSPLIWARLGKIKGEARVEMLICAHHLVCDGWTWAILVQDLSHFYNNPTAELPAPYQYWQYARDLRAQQDRVKTSLEYWKRLYQEPVEPIHFPFAANKRGERSFASKRFDYKIDEVLVKALKSEAAKLGLSFYNYLYANFSLYLAHLSGRVDFAVGISAAPQAALNLKDLAGHCVNLLPIRHRINKSETVKSFYEKAKQNMLAALDHQFCTFGEIISHLPLKRDTHEIPLCNIVFNIDQQPPGQGLNFTALSGSFKSNARVSENFEMFVNATLCGLDLTIENQYNTDLYTAEAIERFSRDFEAFLKARIGGGEELLETIVSIKEVKKVVPTKAPLVMQTASKEHLNYLKGLWRELLGSEVGESANFFASGGHSLLASEMMIKIRSDKKVELGLKDIFRAQTLNDLALLLDQKSVLNTLSTQNSGPVAQVPTPERFPLSMQQKRAWYVQKFTGETAVFNLPSFYHYEGNIDAKALHQAFTLFVYRNAMTRARLIDDRSRPQLEIRTLSVAQIQTQLVRFQKTNLSLEELRQECSERARRPIPIDAENYYSCDLYQLRDGSVVAFTLIHHLIWDGWCYDIYRAQIEALYKALKGKSERALNPEVHLEILGDLPALSYADFSLWQNDHLRSERYQQELNYWREKLAGELPLLSLGLDFPRPKQLSFKGHGMLFSWSEAEVAALEKIARENSQTLYSLLFCAYKLFLMRYSGSEKVIVGTPVRGRNYEGLQNIIGYFVDNIAIASDLDPRLSFNENLKIEALALSEAFDHAEVAFDDIVGALKLKRDASHTPIYQTFFVYQDATNRETGFAGEKFTSEALLRGSVHSDVDIWMRRDPQGMKGGMECQSDLFKRETLERMGADFKAFLQEIVRTHGEAEVNSLELLAPAERERLIGTLNQTECEFPKLSLSEYLVSAWKDVAPDKIAVTSHDGKLSYKELGERSNQLAHFLMRSGVKSGDLVGIGLTRGVNLLVGLLGILKTGAGYVPLDPDYPAERLSYMCEHSQLKVIVCEREQQDHSVFAPYRQVFLDEIRTEAFTKVDVRINPESICYVIYTSGSTGLPKGVALSHRSVVNFLSSMKKTPGLDANDRLCAVTTLSFDIAVLELYLPLSVGATVVVATREEALLADQLMEILRREAVSVMQATPATWRLLLAGGFRPEPGFKILCGGEPFPKDLAHKLIALGASVWNMYGPTETTVWSTCKQITASDQLITIGRPIDNTTIYILDDQMRLRPSGAIGELYIGGSGLALGYYGREDLTQERFLPSPFKMGEWIYKTGDLARYLSNGEIECLGRNDSQVKVRGFRIELGEIEAALAKVAGVSAQVVMIREDRPGDIRIVGYYTAAAEIAESVLRASLGGVLPPYMIPNHFVWLKEFPLTLNGKIDRKKLPAPHQASVQLERATKSQTQFHSPTEAKLAQIWADVLQLPEVTASDDFFEIGGHSLNSVEVFARIESEFGVNLKLSVLFEASRLEALAQLIDQAKTPRPTSLTLTDELTSLVTLRQGVGGKAPIFFFHGVGGNVLNYRLLLKFIASEHNVYGLQSAGVSGEADLPHSIEEMALHYAAEIKRVAPTGPCVLAGGSMGGLLALEVARLLKEDQVQVATVVMFDTFGPGNPGLKTTKSQVSFLARLKTALYYRSKRAWAKMIETLAHMRGRAVPHSVRHFKVEMNNYRLMWKHQVEPYVGDVVLIRSPLTESGRYSEACLGWERIIQGYIDVRYVSGADHNNFVESARAAREFAKVLER